MPLQRRLRQWLRHERLSVAMALAESQHHTSRGQKTARAGRGVRDAAHGEVPEALLPRARHTALCATTVCRSSGAPGLTASTRSGRRSGFCGTPWSRLETSLLGCLLSTSLFVSLSVVAEQVTEVPTIILEDPIPQRALLRAPQLAEQLVEVPTTPGYVFAVVAVQTLGWREARALFEQLTASPGRDTNTGQG